MAPSSDPTVTGTERLAITVVGGGELALEVCRLGRAAGHDIVSVRDSGRPNRDEPWLEGVDWTTPPADDEGPGDLVAGADAVVVLDHPSTLPSVAGEVGTRDPDAAPSRIVLVDGESETLEASASSRIVGLELPPLGGGSSSRPGGERSREIESDAIPIGQAAMAIVRAVVEPDCDGPLSAEEVAELGRSVMIQ